ncbi:MAG: histidine kinase, partial [Gemmatimonadetes bacterium]|nr:histidine kinase [Gemmatimonadota bacterium]
TLAIFRLADRFPLRRGAFLRNLPVHVAAAVLASFFSTTLDAAGDRLQGRPAERPFAERLVRSVRFDATWYCYVLGIALAVTYHRQARDRERQAARLALSASEMETRVARLQLDAARMRLQPELVFATLDTVGALAPRDPAAADALTVRLADLLRMVTDSFGADEVTLARDAAYLSAWAAVMRSRGSGPHVALELADQALDAAVPTFLLQPLVAALADGALVPVLVRAWTDGGDIGVRIDAPEDGPPVDAAALDDALRRLRELHGPVATLERVADAGSRAVVVRLPRRPAAVHAPALTGPEA